MRVVFVALIFKTDSIKSVKYEVQNRRNRHKVQLESSQCKLQIWYIKSTDGIIPATCLATLAVTMLLTACSDATDKQSFLTRNEAIIAYHTRLSEIRKEDKVTMQRLIAIVNGWRVLDDSVTACIKRNTICPSSPLSHGWISWAKRLYTYRAASTCGIQSP